MKQKYIHIYTYVDRIGESSQGILISYSKLWQKQKASAPPTYLPIFLSHWIPCFCFGQMECSVLVNAPVRVSFEDTGIGIDIRISSYLHSSSFLEEDARVGFGDRNRNKLFSFQMFFFPLLRFNSFWAVAFTIRIGCPSV